LIEKLKRDLSKLSAVLLLQLPFYGALFPKLKVKACLKMKTRASVSTRRILYIHLPRWFELSVKDKIHLLVHEIHHAAFHHPKRTKPLKKLWGLCVDAVTTEMIRHFCPPDALKPWTIEHLSRMFGATLERTSSAEELYKELKDKACREYEMDYDLIFDWNREDREGIEVQKGSERLYTRQSTEEEWKQEIAKARNYARAIGKLPASLNRLIDELMKPKLNWQTLLRLALIRGLGLISTSTWKRTGRRDPTLPGIKRMTIPHVWYLVDTSASIDKKDLTRAFSEGYAISKMSKINVICWDAESYEILSAVSPQEFKQKILPRIKGGGGTVIKPVLSKLYKKMRPLDLVVIITDGDIYDSHHADVKKLALQIASKASKAILLTSHSEVKFPRWNEIKL